MPIKFVPASRIIIPVPPTGEGEPPPTTEPTPPNAEDILLRATLSGPEVSYYRSLRKRDRMGLRRMLDRTMGNRRNGNAQVPLRLRVLQSNLPEPLRLKIFEELRTSTCHKYIQWVTKAMELPLGSPCPPPYPKNTSLSEAIAQAKTAMENVISGHDNAKAEVLKMVCTAHQGGSGAPAYSLGLEGLPGTGKTHFVRSALPAALGRPIVSICLGGATDVTYLLGNIYTYEGSREGRIAAALTQAKCSNPILHFDEVDKISATDRGAELAAVLLHLVDPTMNTAIRDRYFHDVDLDLSQCCFVFTYNDPAKVSPILLDRIKRVKMEAPTPEMRAQITRSHIVPRLRARLGVEFDLSDEALQVILDGHTSTAEGMRGVEKDSDHVLAEAQLAIALAGEPNVLNASGEVTGCFAKTRLRRTDTTDWTKIAAIYA